MYEWLAASGSMAVYQGMEVDKVIDEVASKVANEVAGCPLDF